MRSRICSIRSSLSPIYRNNTSNWNNPCHYQDKRIWSSKMKSRTMIKTILIITRWSSLRKTKASSASTIIIRNKSSPTMSHQTRFCTIFWSTPNSSLTPRSLRPSLFRVAARQNYFLRHTIIKKSSSKNSKSWYGSPIGRISHPCWLRKIRLRISRLMQDGAALFDVPRCSWPTLCKGPWKMSRTRKFWSFSTMIGEILLKMHFRSKIVSRWVFRSTRDSLASGTESKKWTKSSKL